MASKTKENYIKALFYLHQRSEDISLSHLGEVLEVSKPTANDMVKKLKVEGIVHSEKYKPIKITEQGKKAAAKIIRKHRLSEIFLLQIMNFGWEEVHDIAEELEHIKIDKFFDRMDELLGFPTTDPHGSPIQLNTKLSIQHIESFDDSYTISYDDQKDVVLSKSVCDRLLVEEV